MSGKCPGSDMRKLTSSLHKCPKCGAEVEMFSDETKRRCQACKEMVTKEQAPACIQWCEAARSCIGEERWKQIMGVDE